jgi:anthranilate/para-aminobenzoate synthase component I
MRNDLGRVCRPGSVRVTEPRLLERHAGVVHTVAEIAGDLRSEVEWEDVLRAVFPAGSITGAPKIRAMQLIGELEPHLRGAYCGSTLWLAEDGTMDLSVNIRTAEITPAAGGGHDLTFGVGAGIVADSDPQAEWAETLTKARGFASAVGASVEPAP